MKGRIDLHLHTNRSDGLLSPEELLERVRERRLVAFAVTDHDSIDGYLRALESVGPDDPELVSGVELSCTMYERDVHMLAYFFDPDSEIMRSALVRFRENRNKRGRLMVQRLEELGVKVSFDSVLEFAAGAPVGRPHVADALVHSGAVGGFNEAFNRYIGDHAPAYVPKTNFTPGEAIDLIHRAGGVAVVAHPCVSGVEERIEELADLGMDGLEAYHRDHRLSDVERLKETARRLRLTTTGGSDFHGRNGIRENVGSEAVPAKLLEELRERAHQVRGQV